jgi:hypothetical protein
LALVGACPGAHSFTIADIPVGGAVALVTGRLGDAVLAGGPCAGLGIGLTDARLLTLQADRDFDAVITLDKVVSGASCGAPVQAIDVTTCVASEVHVIGFEMPVGCPSDWLLDTPCNGADFGGGCTTEETGYHFSGYFEADLQDYACWWHTKNQAWNTDSSTNFWALAENFELEPGVGGSTWCYARGSNPCDSGTCGSFLGGYFDIGDSGAWGWCGGDPFTSGGHVCVPVAAELADRCR